MNPEDIDFPVSDTFRDGLAALHGWPVQPRCKSLREARYDEDLERIKRRREEDEEPSDKDYIKKL